MKKLFYPAIALFALSAIPSEARAQQKADIPGCQTQMEGLRSHLRGVGVSPKPGQGPVQLNNGKWYPVSEIDSIEQELHQAAKLCREGQDHGAATEMDHIRRHLDLAAVPHPESHRPQ
ncbi:exported hypothetical protein [Candidatus Terasakiella magnetica]|nr:exported hypothetical protein [Candidatus Terasakiella magnetica]